MKAKNSCHYIVLVVALTWLQPVSAVPFPPGQLSFSSLEGASLPSGTVIDAATFVFQVGNVDNPSTIPASGSIDARVVREDATQLLRFEYQLSVDADSPGNVDFLTTLSFGDFMTDVDFLLGGAGDIEPTSAQRAGPNRDVITYFYPGSGSGGGLQPGETSLPVFVRTNATNYDTAGTLRVQQGLATHDFNNAFRPTAVPLPGSLILFNFGILMITLIKTGKARR